MSNNKWVRSISFNRTNDKDSTRLKFIGKKSFSKFIKKLLDEEIKRQNTKETTKSTTTIKSATPQPQQQIITPKQKSVIKPQNQYYQKISQPYNPMLEQRRK